jgi:hypothetical protein
MMRDDAAANVMKKNQQARRKPKSLTFEFAEPFEVKAGQLYGIFVDEDKGTAEIVEIVSFKRRVPVFGSERHIAKKI